MVTLHPAVAYYRSADGLLSHKSKVFVSDELGHNSATVYAFLKELISNLKTMLPNLKHIHYYTNSPTSQFRNKTIFYLLSRHKELFNVTASWNYFEAGHGKGPCDGIGGSVKRMSDEAVQQQKVNIQDAPDVFCLDTTTSIIQLRCLHLCSQGSLQHGQVRNRAIWKHFICARYNVCPCHCSYLSREDHG